MHLSPSEALPLQIIDKIKRRSSRVKLIIHLCSRVSVTERWICPSGGCDRGNKSFFLSCCFHFTQRSKPAAVFKGWYSGKAVAVVRQRGCLTLTWRCLCHSSSCHSCVLSVRRCCSSLVPPWWRKLCRRLNVARQSGFPSCCRTGYYTGSSVSSALLVPNQEKEHLSETAHEFP